MSYRYIVSSSFHRLVLCGILLTIATLASHAQTIWRPANVGMEGSNIIAFGYRADGTMLASASGNLYEFQDDRWSLLGSNHWFSSFATTSKGTIISYGRSAIYRSTNDGRTWIEVLDTVEQSRIRVVEGDSILAMAYGGTTTYYSTDDGTTWKERGSRFVDPRSSTWQATNGSLFTLRLTPQFADHQDGLFRSTDDGTTWQLIVPFVPDPYQVPDYDMFAIAPDGTLWLNVGRQVLHSSTNGDSWEEAGSGINHTPVYRLVAGSPGTVYAVAWGVWVDMQLQDQPANNFLSLYRTTNSGEHWDQVLDTLSRPSISIPPVVTPAGVVIARNVHRTVNVDTGQAFKFRDWYSTDKGVAWQPFDSENPIGRIAMHPQSNVVVAVAGTSIYISSDGGVTWNHSTPGTNHIAAAVSSDGYVYVVTNTSTSSQLYRTSDYGATWQLLYEEEGIRDITLAPDNALLLSTTTGWKRSTDDGSTWNPISGIDGSVSLMTSLPNGTMIATIGASAGVNPLLHTLRSTDNGATWQQLGEKVSNIVVANGRMYGIIDGTVHSSTDNGTSWSPDAVGFPRHNVSDLAVGANGQLLASTANGAIGDGVFRSDAPASAPAIASQPQSLSLAVNGVSGSTGMISVQVWLAATEHITLALYDLLGRKVLTLADGAMQSGEHSLYFNGTSMPKGVYLLTLQSGSQSISRKVVID